MDVSCKLSKHTLKNPAIQLSSVSESIFAGCVYHAYPRSTFQVTTMRVSVSTPSAKAFRDLRQILSGQHIVYGSWHHEHGIDKEHMSCRSSSAFCIKKIYISHVRQQRDRDYPHFLSYFITLLFD